MKSRSDSCSLGEFVIGLLLIAPTVAHADTWHLWAGAQTGDERGTRLIASLPNEIWRTCAVGHRHMDDGRRPMRIRVTFLRAGRQVRPPFQSAGSTRRRLRVETRMRACREQRRHVPNGSA